MSHEQFPLKTQILLRSEKELLDDSTSLREKAAEADARAAKLEEDANGQEYVWQLSNARKTRQSARSYRKKAAELRRKARAIESKIRKMK